MDYVPGCSLMEVLRSSVRQQLQQQQQPAEAAASAGPVTVLKGEVAFCGLPERVVQSVLVQLLEVIEYLHQRGICYVVSLWVRDPLRAPSP